MNEQNKNEEKREQSRRPRPIGPVDRAVRQMIDYVDARPMSDTDAMDFPVKEWLAEDAELPKHLRPEEINKRWNDLSPDEREQIVRLQQIERHKNQAKRQRAGRRRPVGPYDKAMQRMRDAITNEK